VSTTVLGGAKTDEHAQQFTFVACGNRVTVLAKG
jgi:hypothetical protein